MFALVAIDHVQLAMPKGREADAEAFYCGVLGFTRVPKPAVMAARGGCWFEAGAVKIHFGGEEPFVPAKKAHPAFLVRELDALAARLTELGRELRWSDEVPGTRRFHADDCFGNRLEFIAAPG